MYLRKYNLTILDNTMQLASFFLLRSDVFHVQLYVFK